MNAYRYEIILRETTIGIEGDNLLYPAVVAPPSLQSLLVSTSDVTVYCTARDLWLITLFMRDNRYIGRSCSMFI